ncbi:hypothetical protein Cfor_00387 [Coptotermes formosanus]|uniref:Uncharacterized protein n=1 Tax=Coptotermes formosanus TaxID=36987 RepID=A0A6L2PUK3_COPFO|nr:hypothetical protein Cfor_00387 [Coptotermes formosanus]
MAVDNTFKPKAAPAGGRFANSSDDFMRASLLSTGAARHSDLADQQTFSA